MSTPKNVIILTSGLAGSSVLAALLAKAGYWTGEETMKKSDYDTWENSELVALNNKILADVEFDKDWVMTFDRRYIAEVVDGFSKIDDTPFAQFVEKCGNHAPWVWKDPRMWLTIRYWRKFIDFSNTVFLVIRREPLQAWISTLNRRQIQTYAHGREYREGILRTIIEFIEECNGEYVSILYEDLMTNPDDVIEQINSISKNQLSLDDFRAVFHGTLYRKQHGIATFFKALAIYLRNFSVRYK